MGLYDRPYAQDERGGGLFGRGGGRGGGRGLGGGGGWSSPRTWSVTMWLIVVNVAVFVLGFMLHQTRWPVQRDIVLFPTAAPVGSVRVDGAFLSPDEMRGLSPYTSAVAGEVESNRSQYKVVRDSQKQIVGVAWFPMTPILEAWGHFSTQKGFLELQVWRLVTFQFLHADLVHIFFNMLGLFVFGKLVEQHLGGRKYLAFYLMCGIAGGLMYLTLNLVAQIGSSLGLGRLPLALYVSATTPLVGASAGVFGVIIASARLHPNDMIDLLFPPVSLKLKYFAYGYVLIAAIGLITQSQNAGGEAAHIGGAIAGFFFISRAHLLGDFFDVFNDSRKAGSGRGAAGRVGGAAAAARGGWLARVFGGARGANAAEYTQADVDRILQKVSEKGLHSLTEAEKRVLSEDTRKHRLRSGEG